MKCKSCGGETKKSVDKEDGIEYPIWVCKKCGDWGAGDDC